jgi:antitoxin component YwqK of YwqJK toxin-antitoxin module
MSTPFPEFIFAEIASLLGECPEGDLLRKYCGNSTVRDDIRGSTYRNGVLHSYDDKPAEIRYGRFAVWYKNGKVHRDDDLPAYVDLKHPETYLKWYKNGKIHREGDLPAVIDNSKKKGRIGDVSVLRENIIEIWYKNGVIHRGGDLPAYIGGKTRKWYKNGSLHREDDMPALIECDTDMYDYGQEEPHYYISWYYNGVLHREGDRPARVSGKREHVFLFVEKNLPKPADIYEQRYMERYDLPCYFWGSVRLEWFQEGLYHREGDKPAIRHDIGYAVWYKKGKKHRDDPNKPVVISGDTASWIVNGEETRSCSVIPPPYHQWY